MAVIHAAALIAAGCEQYKICHTGKRPCCKHPREYYEPESMEF